MWYNVIMKGLLESPLHPLLSRSMMVVYYTGRKSGQAYSLPIAYVQEGQTLWTVSYQERTWWRNLRGGAAVKLRWRGQVLAGQGEVIEGEGVQAALRHYLELVPSYARYFNIKLVDGQIDEADLAAAAARQVMIRFRLAS
jgi:deazaflavin-dependent oxidoreductase (nitroreductase family)